jgi:hypothetical protein
MGGPLVTSNGTVEIAAQQSDDKTIVLAVGGTGAQSLAAGASVAMVVSRATMEGTIESGARVTAPTIAVTAQQTGTISPIRAAASQVLNPQRSARLWLSTILPTKFGQRLVSANVNSNIKRADPRG